MTFASIPGLPGYLVSDLGDVVGKRGRPLKQQTNRQGYRTVKIAGPDGRKKHRLVHRLVLIAFVGDEPSLDGCHENGDCLDNRLANLKWGTRAENIRDQVRHGTHANAAKTHCLNDHPLTPANTYPSALPERRCITCARERAARQYKRKKALA